jgi:hypothetical protein
MKPAALMLAAAFVIVAGADAHATGQTRAAAYHGALKYLRTTGLAAAEADETDTLALTEAIAADPAIAGPRSTAVLSSLELHSLDAIARRIRTLAPLGLGVDADAATLVAVLSLARVRSIYLLNPSQRSATRRGTGRTASACPSISTTRWSSRR